MNLPFKILGLKTDSGLWIEVASFTQLIDRDRNFLDYLNQLADDNCEFSDFRKEG